MIWALLALFVWTLVLHRRVRKLKREQVATVLQMCAMFQKTLACDDALAAMIEERTGLWHCTFEDKAAADAEWDKLYGENQQLRERLEDDQPSGYLEIPVPQNDPRLN